MNWEPITESELRESIADAIERMSQQQRSLWEVVRVPPQKWSLSPWGDEGGGFWVVGLIERHAIWFNDIEEGYNVSGYSEPGTIDEYWCNQDELEWVLHRIQERIKQE